MRKVFYNASDIIYDSEIAGILLVFVFLPLLQ